MTPQQDYLDGLLRDLDKAIGMDKRAEADRIFETVKEFDLHRDLENPTIKRYYKYYELKRKQIRTRFSGDDRADYQRHQNARIDMSQDNYTSRINAVWN